MPLSKIVRPKQTLRGNELDVREVPKLGKDLYDVIAESCVYTQKFVVTKYPDVLVVSQRQFASLNDYTTRMEETEDRIMYIEGHNVMEVVVDREADNYEPVEAVKQLVEDELKLSEETKQHEDQETGNSDNPNQSNRSLGEITL